jgi:hypothetical protein
VSLAVVALVVLCGCCGYATTVWIYAGTAAVRARQRTRAGVYWLLALLTLFSTVVIAARLVERPIDLPMGVTSLILIPLVAIPAALTHKAALDSKKLITVELARMGSNE